MKKTKYLIVLVLFLISLTFSIILSFVSLEKACGGIETSCYAVQTSKYETTFGIKNAYLGILAFLIISILTLMHIKSPTKEKKRTILLGAVFASLIAIYFLYIQFFVLDSLCKYCIIIDTSSLIALGIICLWKEK